MHGLVAEDVAGETRRHLIAIQIYNRVRTGSVITDNRTIHRVFQTVCYFALEVVRRCEDGAVLIVAGDLKILVVMTGCRMESGFTSIETCHSAIVVAE